MSRIVLFINGEVRDLAVVRAALHGDDRFVVADGGLRHLQMLGLSPSVIVGDMDSVDAESLAQFTGHGVEVIHYPRNKNETDFELALGYAVASKPNSILVVGALGGRLDQTLGNLSLLAGEKYSHVEIGLEDGLESAWFVRDRLKFQGLLGEIVSLIPWGKDVYGVTCEGLRWQLDDETLFVDQTRGISNEMIASSCSVSVRAGLLLVVRRRNPKKGIQGEE